MSDGGAPKCAGARENFSPSPLDGPAVPLGQLGALPHSPDPQLALQESLHGRGMERRWYY